MRVLEDLLTWWRSGQAVGLATVVETWRSAPRPPGAMMLVAPDGTVAGSVSGGCVETAVYELCREVLTTGTPVRRTYGVSDHDAYDVGLPCGGSIDLFVERIDRATYPQLDQVATSIAAGDPVAVATCVEASTKLRGRRIAVWQDRVSGTLGEHHLDATAVRDARAMLAENRTDTLRYGPDGPTLFVSTHAPPPRLLVFGAVDFAAAVSHMGRYLGYHVTVCDARPVFATEKRFPAADEVTVAWPHRYLQAQLDQGKADPRTVVCVLTHDPKFDVPVLDVALRAPFAYVGAMGSRRTHDDRLARLRAAGVPPDALARLHSPLGLDLGARTPEETAVSIAAEIIASRHGAQAHPLTTSTGRIHQKSTPKSSH